MLESFKNLFVTLAAGTATRKSDEFDFVVDRAARKVVSLPFGRRETVRVRTGRSYEWVSTDIAMPDTSTGRSQLVTFRVTIRGTIDSEAGAARNALEGALQYDLDADAAFNQGIGKAINDRGSTLSRQLAETLLSVARVRDLEADIQAQCLRVKLPVQSVTVRPVLAESDRVLDLNADGELLPIRSRDLVAFRFHFTVRLEWGSSTAHHVARMAYRGSIYGATAGSRLDPPLVAGQVQPLEAWFRRLLAEALGKESAAELRSISGPALARVGNVVSEELAKGTGRIITGLTLYPVLNDAGAHPERTLQFDDIYPIVGLSGSGLQIAHSIRYRKIDEERWKAQGSKDPQVFLREQIGDAIRAWLSMKSFQEVVALYLTAGYEVAIAQQLIRAIAVEVAANGLEMVSMLAVLRIPEQEFIHGTTVHVLEHPYKLHATSVMPRIVLHAVVRVGEDADQRRVFTATLAGRDDFGRRVAAALQDAVATKLRDTAALTYYASSYVNGVGALPTPDGQVIQLPPTQEEPLRQEMWADVSARMREFGLSLDRLELVPGQDPISERLSAFKRRRISYTRTFEFGRGSQVDPLKAEASATIVVMCPDAWNWDAFQGMVGLELQDHEEKLKGLLTETIERMNARIAAGTRETLPALQIDRIVAEEFSVRAAREFGLKVQILVQLNVWLPRALQWVADTELLSLRQQYALLLEKKRQLLLATSAASDDWGGDTAVDPVAVVDRQLEQTRERISTVHHEATVVPEVIQLGSNPMQLRLADQN